jgi:tRNA modification GTPase
MNYANQDTIVAVATASGRAALSLVRLSGTQALAIADRIFEGAKKPSEMESHTLQHGYIVSQRGQRVDEVVLSVFKKPHSYTGEDTVEITCHGGQVMSSAIVEVAIVAGARPAGPGEFTFRAFCNGRLDLAQAEAVAEIISAGTWAAARAAIERLEGGLSRRIGRIREDLLNILAQLEAAVDFPEEDLPQPVGVELNRILEDSWQMIRTIVEESRTTQILNDGARVVIAGRPNTGKSSLFNLLLREERAIVTDEPGTTRDVLEGFIEIRGVPVRLFDTAGLRQSKNPIEMAGMERARGKLAQADLILLVIDGSQPPRAEDKRLLDKTRDRPRLVILNKSDLKPAFAAQKGWLRLSALTGDGLQQLEEAMIRALTDGRGLDEIPASAANLRQIGALGKAGQHLCQAKESLQAGTPYDLVAEDIRAGIYSLDEVTGQAWRGQPGVSLSDEVLAMIFKKFCIGK